MNIPISAKKIDVKNATVDFFEDEDYYYFDTSLTAAPEPMVNALAGLKLLDRSKKLVMINHKIQMGLFPKIEDYFDFKIEEFEDFVKITFSKKIEECIDINFDTNCKG